MKDESVFLDTNILVYAHDKDAGERHSIARDLLRTLWLEDRPPSISVQVLQELYVNLQKKKVAEREIKEAVNDYLEWHVIDNDRDLLTRAIEERARYEFSFWDALILAAARRAGSKVLWSEDFNTGQNYGGIRAVNPLITRA